MGDLITYPNDEFLHEKFVAPTIQKYLQGKLLGESLATVRDIGDADSMDSCVRGYPKQSYSSA